MSSTATLHTTLGDIVIELFPNHAPKTVENFVGLATGAKEWTDPRTGKKSTEKLYDGTIFHRVIDEFMIQGGCPQGTGTGGPGYNFADEFHPDLLFTKPYLLAMANAGPGTNGSQFFITTTATPHLNMRHTIFGEVADDETPVPIRASNADKYGIDLELFKMKTGRKPPEWKKAVQIASWVHIDEMRSFVEIH